jgi:hypothetical protein
LGWDGRFNMILWEADNDRGRKTKIKSTNDKRAICHYISYLERGMCLCWGDPQLSKAASSCCLSRSRVGGKYHNWATRFPKEPTKSAAQTKLDDEFGGALFSKRLFLRCSGCMFVPKSLAAIIHCINIDCNLTTVPNSASITMSIHCPALSKEFPGPFLNSSCSLSFLINFYISFSRNISAPSLHVSFTVSYVLPLTSPPYSHFLIPRALQAQNPEASP